MNKGILSLLCVSLVVLMPACRQDGNEGNMKQDKAQTRKKTEKKTYTRKKQNGGVTEETTTTKSETKQQQPMK
jgi:hypothetical protein